jgi:hypothetical protein
MILPNDASQIHVHISTCEPFTTIRYPFFGTKSRIYCNRDLMFSRLSQVARHLSRPVPNFAHASAANFRSSLTSSVMAGATTTPPQKGLIHTAACLIIGDEVLGGKVHNN